jgi:hypothetical protein
MGIFSRLKELVKRIKEKITRKREEKDVIIFTEQEAKEIKKDIEKVEKVIEKPKEIVKVEKPKIEKPKIEKPKKPRKMQVLYINVFQFYCKDLRYKERKYIHTFKIASKTKQEIMAIRTRVLNEHHKHFPYHYVEKYQYIRTDVKVIFLKKKAKKEID